MAKKISADKLAKQLQKEIKELGRGAVGLMKSNDTFEDRVDKLQDKIGSLKDNEKISQEAERELKLMLDEVEKGVKTRATFAERHPDKNAYRVAERELIAMEKEVKEKGKTDEVENGLDALEHKIEELKKLGVAKNQVKKLENRLDQIK